MKNLLTKTLFISLLLSAAISSAIKANPLDLTNGIHVLRTKIANLSGTIKLYRTYYSLVKKSGINFWTAIKVAKKTKTVCNNKWVRYSVYGTGTVLAMIADIAMCEWGHKIV